MNPRSTITISIAKNGFIVTGAYDIRNDRAPTREESMVFQELGYVSGTNGIDTADTLLGFIANHFDIDVEPK